MSKITSVSALSTNKKSKPGYAMKKSQTTRSTSEKDLEAVWGPRLTDNPSRESTNPRRP